MKKITFIFSGLLLIVSSFTLVAHLYTKEKVENLGSNLGNSASFGYTKSFSLGYLLANNMMIYGEEQYIYDEKTNTFKNAWRDLIASNPTLAYSAFDMYSADFTSSFKKSLETQKAEQIKYFTENPFEGSNEEIARMKAVNADAVLKNSVANMKNYQKLIDELLKLDDTKLNSLIKSIGKDPAFFYSETEKPVQAKELLTWLATKGFISKSEDGNIHFSMKSQFPSDIILLSNRVSSNYPQWTNRKFLQEAKKFSLHVEKNFKY